MKHIAGREGGRAPLRGKRGQNENLLEISIMAPWKPLQRKRWTRRATPPSPAYTAKRGLSKNLLKISSTTTWKISPRGGNLSNSTTTSSYCSHCNLLVARFLLRTNISPRNALLFSRYTVLPVQTVCAVQTFESRCSCSRLQTIDDLGTTSPFSSWQLMSFLGQNVTSIL